MILYKIAGVCAILTSGLIVYIESQKYENKKLNQLDAYITLIDYIKNQVECFLLPIDEIICKCDILLLNRCGITEGIEKVKTIEDIVAASELYIDQDALSLIDKFAKEYGRAYRAEQVRSCVFYKEELLKIYNNNKKSNDEQKKVRLAISLCVSFSIILILI